MYAIVTDVISYTQKIEIKGLDPLHCAMDGTCESPIFYILGLLRHTALTCIHSALSKLQ